MTRAERRELLTAALMHLDVAANLLEEAEEEFWQKKRVS